jgi:AcrR family transcriptional regulator
MATGQRARKTKEAKAALYRELVLEAAQALFAANGYAGTKMEDVARAADFAPATLYKVFPSKEAIFQELLERGVWGILEQSRAKARQATTALDTLFDSLRGSHEYLIEHPEFLRIQLWETRSWAFQESARTTAWDQAFAGLQSLFERCIKEGSVQGDDAILMTQVTLALQQTLLARWLETGAKVPAEQATQQLIELVERAFVNSKTKRRTTVRRSPD